MAKHSRDDGRLIWLIGCGNMAGAMLEGWLASGLPAGRFQAVRPSGNPVAGDVEVHRDLPAEPFGKAVVQLGFKPHMLAGIAPDLARLIGPETILVSILAGVELETLAAALPGSAGIVRAMPNLPVALGNGAVGLISEDPDSAEAQLVGDLMARLGLAEWLDGEDGFNALTALAGSGPAFLFRFIDALARAGADIGLEAGQARRLALATVDGAASMAAGSDLDAGALADRVASPGGSTRKGLDVLDADGALDRLVAATLAAAKRRNEEMAAEAKS
ncbi:MAG: pyrroline-5-carboxylate reductase [Parasphingopyxis sp.]